MDEYTAALQIERPSEQSPQVFAAGSVLRIRGVHRAVIEPATGEMVVNFDRSQVTIGDLVRWIEDQGLSVGSVAQQRFEVVTTARAATA